MTEWTHDIPDLKMELARLIAQHTGPGWAGVGALPDPERGQFLAKWRESLRTNGLLAPTWPEEYGGRNLTIEGHAVLFGELYANGLPLWTDTDAVGVSLVGNAILQWGGDAMKKRFLPRILSGEHVWCQGFSEPNAGSDLASVSTRAVAMNGQWTINGQKSWSSAAMRANWIFILARTEFEASAHKGLSMLLVPMDQEGIEVRPVTNLRGEDEFCEIFFTDAKTDEHLALGGRGAGWSVAMSILGHERGETVLYIPSEFAEELKRLHALAEETASLSDESILRRLVWCGIDVAQLEALSAQSIATLSQGKNPASEGAVFKVLYTEYHQKATELALDIIGPEAVAMRGLPSCTWLRANDPGSPNTSRSWLEVYLNALAGSVYSGTNEIQRNIIAERILGLPRS